MTQTDAIINAITTDVVITSITVQKLFIKGRRKHGLGITALGETVYIPSRLVPHLTEGEIVQAKLKPSIDPRSKYFMVEICYGQKKYRSGVKRYDRDNVVERTPGIRSSN